MRIGTAADGSFAVLDVKLHPALGLGEDWNTGWVNDRGGDGSMELHPALGLGEDWNDAAAAITTDNTPSKLHPALGLGEDWNTHLDLGETRRWDCTRL